MDLHAFALKHHVKLHRDMDGTEIGQGRDGHIYDHGNGLLAVIVMPKADRKGLWSRSRRTFVGAGMAIVQDGEAEGAATFHPSDREQVKAALKAAGIKSGRRPTERQLEALKRYRRSFGSKAHVDKRPLCVASSAESNSVSI